MIEFQGTVLFEVVLDILLSMMPYCTFLSDSELMLTYLLMIIVSYCSQKGGISSSCSPAVAMTSPCSGREHTLIESDTPLVSPHSPSKFSKVVAATPKEDKGEGAVMDNTCHQNEPKLRRDVIDLSKDASEEDGCIRDLNVEPSSWLFPEKEAMLPGPSSLGNHTHIETVRTLENVSTDR